LFFQITQSIIINDFFFIKSDLKLFLPNKTHFSTLIYFYWLGPKTQNLQITSSKNNRGDSFVVHHSFGSKQKNKNKNLEISHKPVIVACDLIPQIGAWTLKTDD